MRTTPLSLTILFAGTLLIAPWLSAQSAMPTPRNGLAADVIHGQLYAVGGANDTEILAVLEIYDPQADCWAEGAPLQTARTETAAVALGGKLYVLGGITAGGPTATVEVYDPASNTWHYAAPMPTARRGVAAGVIGGKIYAVGGLGSQGTPIASVES